MRMCILPSLITVPVPNARKYENKMKKKIIPTIYRLGQTIKQLTIDGTM